MQMLLTGDLIDAQNSYRMGLVNEVVDAEQLERKTMELAQKIASKSPLTVAIGKEAYYRQTELPLSEAYDYTKEVMVRNLEARDAQEESLLSLKSDILSGGGNNSIFGKF